MTASFRRLLLPTRFALYSRRAAEYVRPLRAAFGAEVHLIHVVVPGEAMIDPGLPGAGMPIVAGPSVAELLDEARRRLEEFAGQEFAESGPPVHAAAVSGLIADEIVHYAAQQAVDVIVMGTHADGMLKRLVFGSVGKSVLERAPCPVLLVPVRDAPR